MIVRGTPIYLGLFLIVVVFVGGQFSAAGLADPRGVMLIAVTAQNAFVKAIDSIIESIALTLTVGPVLVLRRRPAGTGAAGWPPG